MAHTKGPWKVVFGNIVGADNKDIFHQSVMLENVKTAGEMEANARLIASAPELLEALKAILEYAEEYCDSGPEGEEWKSDKQSSDIAFARATISKAEGKE